MDNKTIENIAKQITAAVGQALRRHADDYPRFAAVRTAGK